MAFASGAVSFRRYFVTGRLAGGVTDAMVEKIAAHAFGRGSLIGMDQTECGWIAPTHLFDNDVTAEKITLGRFVHLGVRLDRLKIPANVLKSYVHMEEQVALEATGREYLSRAEKRNARDAAMIRADKEMRSGTFRRSTAFPVLIDLKKKAVYLGNTGSTAGDKLLELFRETFDATLEPADAERLAYRLTEALGNARSLENASPCHLVPDEMEFAPEGDDDGGQTFLGREFLSWLWRRSESNDGPVQTAAGDTVALAIDRTIRLQCDFGRSGSTTLMRDGPAGAPEAHAAIRIGKQPTRLGLILGGAAGEFSFTLDGPKMTVSSLSLPKDEEQRSAVEWIEHRFEQVSDFNEMLDGLYGAFLKRRLADDWPREHAAMKAWARADAPRKEVAVA